MSIKCDTVLLMIVVDLNDNTPVFSEEAYTFSVPELTETLVGFAVSANDTDMGLNGLVSYTLLDGNDEGLFNLGMELLTESTCLVQAPMYLQILWMEV